MAGTSATRAKLLTKILFQFAVNGFGRTLYDCDRLHQPPRIGVPARAGGDVRAYKRAGYFSTRPPTSPPVLLTEPSFIVRIIFTRQNHDRPPCKSTSFASSPHVYIHTHVLSSTHSTNVLSHLGRIRIVTVTSADRRVVVSLDVLSLI